jgi:hypothetical protein
LASVSAPVWNLVLRGDAALVRPPRQDDDLLRLDVEVPQQQGQHGLADAAEAQHDDLACDSRIFFRVRHGCLLVVQYGGRSRLVLCAS